MPLMHMGDKCVEDCPPWLYTSNPNHAAWSACTGDHVLFWADVLLTVTQEIFQKMGNEATQGWMRLL